MAAWYARQNSRGGLVGVDEDWEERTAYLVIIIGSLIGGGHQNRERVARVRVRVVGRSSNGVVGMQCHAGARKRLGARLVGFLPVDTGLATLLWISIALSERGRLCQGAYSRDCSGALVVGKVIL